MSRDAAVEVTCYDCEHCGAANAPSFHDGDGCEGVVVDVGGEWRCADCGVRISPVESCFECGERTRPARLAVPLDCRPAVAPRAVERAVHERTNRRRRDNGRSPLSYSDHLAAVALRHSRDMASRDYFSHDSPEGEDAGDRYRRFGHDDRSVGENIALRQVAPTTGADGIAEGVVAGWMDSPGHRENLLRDRFDEEGLGVFTTADGTVYVTQNFR